MASSNCPPDCSPVQTETEVYYTPSGTKVTKTKTTQRQVIPAARARASGIPRRTTSTRPSASQLQSQPPVEVLKAPPMVPPSELKTSVFQEALSKSKLDPKGRGRATGRVTSRVRPPMVQTKSGLKPAIQQTTVEETVQRTPKLEYVGKYVKSIDASKGSGQQAEFAIQQVDHAYGTEDAGLNDSTTVIRQLSVTDEGTYLTKTTSTNKKIAPSLQGPNLNPLMIQRLVEEESKDVETTLKILPPDLITGSEPEKFPLKKKLKMLRLTSESIAQLQQSIILPEPTADEADTEAPPEVMASIVQAMEKGAVPASAPNEIFNTLFPEAITDKRIVSSVAPGPFSDIAVPLQDAPQITDEVLTDEMEQTIKSVVQDQMDAPKDDICTQRKILPAVRESKKEHKNPTLIALEAPPWQEDDVKNVSLIMGSAPIFQLKAIKVEPGDDRQNITAELQKGIDYYLESDACAYENRVQLRGSRLPNWFPGYMEVFPHLTDYIGVAKSPSKVLHTAWRAVQPKLFDEDSVIYA